MPVELKVLQVFKMDEIVRQTIYHGTSDITNLVTSTRFTQRENGVTDLEFTTAIDNGARFDININDRISVAYDDGVHGNKKVFDGYIENKEHAISSQGEFVKFFATDSVCAVLKRMIVNLDFGTQSRIGILNPNVDQKLSNAVLQILHDFVARVSGNPINQDKPNSFSDFKTNYWINDGYIWQEPNSVKFPFISLKYCNALEAVTNLVKLYGALSFKRAIDTNGTNPYRGVHWIPDAENNLLLAPVGNHDVESTTGNQIAGLWHTYANNGTVLTIGTDPIVSFSFVEEAPYANLVYVAGKYQFPSGDELTEPVQAQGTIGGANIWKQYQKQTFPPTNIATRLTKTDNITDSKIAITKNKYSLKLLARPAYLTGFNDLVWQPNGFDVQDSVLVSEITTESAPALFLAPINGEFTKLITPDSSANINFSIYKDNGVTRTNLVLLNKINTGSSTDPAYQDCDGFCMRFDTPEEVVQRQTLDLTYDDIAFAPTTKWVKIGNGNWDNIKYIGFSYRVDALHMGFVDRSIYVDDLFLGGSMIRGVTDQNMWSLTEDVGDGYWIRNRRMNPAYKYPLRMFTVRDSLASSDNLLSEPQSSDSLYLSALAHLIQYGSPMIRGTLSIPLNTNYIAGQFLRIKHGRDSNWYKDNNADYKTFRITSVTHSFSEQGAFTTLEVCNDLINGTPRLENDYTTAVRALSPRWQDQTFASLFTENSWDNDAYIAASRVNLSKIDF
jgi:hypothetical protein